MSVFEEIGFYPDAEEDVGDGQQERDKSLFPDSTAPSRPRTFHRPHRRRHRHYFPTSRKRYKQHRHQQEVREEYLRQKVVRSIPTTNCKERRISTPKCEERRISTPKCEERRISDEEREDGEITDDDR